MKIKSLGLKISLIVAFMIAMIIVTIVFIVSAQSEALMTELTLNQVKAANVTVAKELKALQHEAEVSAGIIGYSHEVINAILTTDETTLKRALLQFGADVDTVMVTDAEGNVILRKHNDQKGDNVYGQEIVSNTLSNKKGYSTIAKGTTVGLATRGSSVIFDYDGNVIGAVICGHDLSLPKYIDKIKELSNSEVTLFDGDTRLNTTLVDDNGERVVGTKASDEVIETVLNQGQDYTTRTILLGSEFAVYYTPLVVNDQTVGMLFAGINTESIMTAQQAMMNMVIMAGIICGVICVLLIIVFTTVSVSKPLKKIGVFAEKIRTGDVGVSTSTTASINVRSSDEVGILARALEDAYAQLQGYVREIKDRMQGLAEGDLATESVYDFHGDFVLIKDSMNDIVVNLNRIMTEVNHSSAQVSSGAKQVADGAQSLAQGSTEQAATVQQLSSTISSIAGKTKANADLASRASALAGTIMHNAEKGNRQMDEMMTAVNEINQASHSISKVIKVIDDIAFQTNILALNAAVEAARAGQHGKGFAVVAEEVRNLAAKSAEAAKDTGGLIANSMEKAELGAKIAGETATSLAEIVSGISESSQLVGEIARSSEEQNAGILQINTGIDQVAQVTQQNSATAEESAAASEEMSSQSALLEEMISQFKLKSNNSSIRNLPPAARRARRMRN